jgi:hypothetical protein
MARVIRIWDEAGPGKGKAATRLIEKNMNTPATGFRIIHELSGQIRLRLAQPCFAAAEFEAQIADLDGVKTVRTNRQARSLVVVYDGRAEVRAGLLQWLGTLPPNAFQHGCDPEPSSHPDRTSLIVSSLALLSLPFLPAPLKAAVTVASVSPTVIKGIRTLLNRGVKMEVLDALAVSIAAGQGGGPSRPLYRGIPAPPVRHPAPRRKIGRPSGVPDLRSGRADPRPDPGPNNVRLIFCLR